MTDAAFINAISESGTKEEAIRYLQETWNELTSARDRVLEVEERCAKVMAKLELERERAEKAEAELAECLEDAERYRWLRILVNHYSLLQEYRWQTPEQFDAAIEAARAAENTAPNLRTDKP
jgi:hypothetical protein